MSGKALAILGISLSAVIIATLLLFVIVNRGGQVQTKDRENAEQAAQFNDTLSKLRNDIAALRSDLSKKADADNSISKEQFSRGTRGFVTKDALAGYSTALDLRALRQNLSGCLKALESGSTSDTIDRKTSGSSTSTKSTNSRAASPGDLPAECNFLAH